MCPSPALYIGPQIWPRIPSLSTEYRLKSQSINATRRSRIVFLGAWCIHAHHHRNFAVLHSPAQSSLPTISESARPLFSLLFSRAPPLSLASSRHPYSFSPPSPVLPPSFSLTNPYPRTLSNSLHATILDGATHRYSNTTSTGATRCGYFGVFLISFLPSKAARDPVVRVACVSPGRIASHAQLPPSHP